MKNQRMKSCVAKFATVAVLTGMFNVNAIATEGNNTPAEFTIKNDILMSREHIAPFGVNRAGNPFGCLYSV